MARKIPFILFLAVLLIALFNPSSELGLNSVDYTRALNDPAVIVASTPEPTTEPTPTPIPTPTPVPTPEPTPMVRGNSGPEVKVLQNQLRTLGFLPGEPDGIYGKDTETAVIAFQTYLNSCWLDDNPAPTPVPIDSTDGAALADEPVASQTQTLPYKVTGELDAKTMDALNTGNFPLYRETAMTINSISPEVRRLQSRLNTLQYTYKNVDAAFGQTTEDGLRRFQEVNGLPATGIADQITLNALYSPGALESDKPLHPYMAVVDVSDQRVYIYAYSSSTGKYNKRVKTFICSTGLPKTPTPLGTYSEGTGPGNRWHYFKDFNCWAQWASYIDGDIMFHSVIYSRRSTSSLSSGSLYNLGSRASHGCVRLKVKDAKWIHQNLNAGSTVIVRK